MPAAAITLFLFLLGGCAALPLDSPGIPHPSSWIRAVFTPDYQEVVGVIHVHSTYSDGRLGVEEIAQIANSQGLDFLVLTDHDTLQPLRDGKARQYGRTLVVAAEEISTRGGHYLALRVDREVPRSQNSRWTIDAVSARGGLGFVAHPFWPRRPWKDLEVQGMTGLEIYSAVHDVSEENLIWLGLGTVFLGSELTLLQWLDRPDDSLALWDRWLARGDKVVGIGSPDAHGLRRFGLHLGPYSSMFKLVRNHVWISKPMSEKTLLEALEKGHLFVAHDLAADSKGFAFLAIRDDAVQGIPGDSIRFRTGLILYAYLPSPGELIFFKDGREQARVKGHEGRLKVEGPGVYRVEATRSGKPWIYSNPIYVVE